MSKPPEQLGVSPTQKNAVVFALFAIELTDELFAKTPNMSS